MSGTTAKTICILIPAHNEADNLPEIVKTVTSLLSKAPVFLRFVIVDDGSTDHTWDALEKLSQENSSLKAIRLSRNFGKENAIAAGLEAASGDAVILLDADFQHPPELILSFLTKWRDEGYDIVEAVKIDRGEENLVYRLFSRAFYWIVSVLSGLELSDSCDFKLLDRKVIESWSSLRERTMFFRGLTSWLGFRRTQIPFEVSPRRHGRSSFSLLELIRLAITGITSFTSAPLHIVSILGTLFLGFAVVVGTRGLYVKFMGSPPDGISLLLFVHLLTGGAIMISLGIIGIYLARIFDEVKARPRFVVSDRTFPPPSSITHC